MYSVFRIWRCKIEHISEMCFEGTGSREFIFVVGLCAYLAPSAAELFTGAAQSSDSAGPHVSRTTGPCLLPLGCDSAAARGCEVWVPGAVLGCSWVLCVDEDLLGLLGVYCRGIFNLPSP